LNPSLPTRTLTAYSLPKSTSSTSNKSPLQVENSTFFLAKACKNRTEFNKTPFKVKSYFFFRSQTWFGQLPSLSFRIPLSVTAFPANSPQSYGFSATESRLPMRFMYFTLGNHLFDNLLDRFHYNGLDPTDVEAGPGGNRRLCWSTSTNIFPTPLPPSQSFWARHSAPSDQSLYSSASKCSER